MKTAKGVVIMTDGSQYNVFEKSASGTAKKVMLGMMKYMGIDSNLIIMKNKTIDLISKDSGLSQDQIRNGITELKKLQLIEPTRLLTAEYIIDPTFAFKGDKTKVWRAYGTIEQKLGNTEATIIGGGAVKLLGKALDLLDTDYTIAGKDAEERRKIVDIYYRND